MTVVESMHVIVNATALAYGHDPASHQYHQEKNEASLVRGGVFLERKLKLFQYILPTGCYRSTEKLSVYCLCRMPEIAIHGSLLECRICQEWFHIDVCVYN